MIGVTAKLTIQPSKAAEFEAAAKDLMAKVKANEPGCTMYQLYKKSDSEYVFMETYASQEALTAHGKTEYFVAAQAPLGACLAGAPEISVMTIVE